MKSIQLAKAALKVFISNNIHTAEYAKNVECPVYMIGSTGNKVLSVSLQEKLSAYFRNYKLKLFKDISHEDYFHSEEVMSFIKEIID